MDFDGQIAGPVICDAGCCLPVQTPFTQAIWKAHLSRHGCGSTKRYPKWIPGKWKHGLKPAVPWWFHFDPYPHENGKGRDRSQLGARLLLHDGQAIPGLQQLLNGQTEIRKRNERDLHLLLWHVQMLTVFTNMASVLLKLLHRHPWQQSIPPRHACL